MVRRSVCQIRKPSNNTKTVLVAVAAAAALPAQRPSYAERVSYCCNTVISEVEGVVNPKQTSVTPSLKTANYGGDNFMSLPAGVSALAPAASSQKLTLHEILELANQERVASSKERVPSRSSVTQRVSGQGLISQALASSSGLASAAELLDAKKRTFKDAVQLLADTWANGEGLVIRTSKDKKKYYTQLSTTRRSVHLNHFFDFLQAKNVPVTARPQDSLLRIPLVDPKHSLELIGVRYQSMFSIHGDVGLRYLLTFAGWIKQQNGVELLERHHTRNHPFSELVAILRRGDDGTKLATSPQTIKELLQFFEKNPLPVQLHPDDLTANKDRVPEALAELVKEAGSDLKDFQFEGQLPEGMAPKLWNAEKSLWFFMTSLLGQLAAEGLAEKLLAITV